MHIVWTSCILTQKIALYILPRHYAKWPISHISHNIYINRVLIVRITLNMHQYVGIN